MFGFIDREVGAEVLAEKFSGGVAGLDGGFEVAHKDGMVGFRGWGRF